jgi:hypothetical protein
MLVGIPPKCYEKLMPPVQRNQQEPAKEFEYEGRNMEAVAKLLDFLDRTLSRTEQVSNIFYNSNS